MNKSESKYFNTAIKMDLALISLLKKKPFDYITVIEICKEAGVNRSTFYLHYETVGDLLQEPRARVVAAIVARHKAAHLLAVKITDTKPSAQRPVDIAQYRLHAPNFWVGVKFVGDWSLKQQRIVIQRGNIAF